VSLGELTDYLQQARAHAVNEVVIFSHSFELFYIDDLERRRATLSRLNLSRLRGLCRFLRAHADEFEVDTVGDLAARLARGERPAASNGHELLRGKPLSRYRRMVEQLYKRVESGFKVQSHYWS
jgi:hypothetical protein